MEQFAARDSQFMFGRHFQEAEDEIGQDGFLKEPVVRPLDPNALCISMSGPTMEQQTRLHNR